MSETSGECLDCGRTCVGVLGDADNPRVTVPPRRGEVEITAPVWGNSTTGRLTEWSTRRAASHIREKSCQKRNCQIVAGMAGGLARHSARRLTGDVAGS